MHDFANALTYSELLRSVSLSASKTDATGVDISGAVGTIKVMLSATKTSGTTPTCAVKLQECDTVGGTYSDVTNGAFATLTDASGTEALAIDSRAVKKFLKAYVTLGGTNPVFDVAVIAAYRSQAE